MERSDLGHTHPLFTGLVDDRRRYPRIDTSCPGQVLLASGEKIDVTVRDFSPDGLQIRCPRANSLDLHPSGRSIPAGARGPDLRLTFTLPLPGEPAPVSVVGAIVHFALVDANVVAIGLQFNQMSPASARHVKRFIRLSLEPRDPAMA